METASSALIGRDGPLAALDAALAGAGSGRPSAVLAGGEAGVGKSRLVGAFAERSRAAGARTLTGPTSSACSREARRAVAAARGCVT
jgi:predicted ATP-dependent serine protease